jgi:hypothetical protein
MTTIREFTNSAEAGLLVSFLRENDIEADLADENASAWSVARLLVPIRLQVPDADVEKAEALLKEFANAPLLDEESSS